MSHGQPLCQVFLIEEKVCRTFIIVEVRTHPKPFPCIGNILLDKFGIW